MKAYRGIRGVTPRVLILVSRWLVVNGQRHVLAALHPRSEPDVCWPYAGLDEIGEEKSLCLYRDLNSRSSSAWLVLKMCSSITACWLYFLDEWPGLNLLFKESKTAVLSRRHKLI